MMGKTYLAPGVFSYLFVIIVIIAALMLSFLQRPPFPGPDTEVWCDPTHTIPYITADRCGGGSSCDRAQFAMGSVKDWPAFCAKINRDAQ